MAARVGVSKATVVNLEAGKNVSFETVIAVVQVLGLAVELDDLFLYAPKTIADLEKTAALPTRVRKLKAFYGPKDECLLRRLWATVSLGDAGIRWAA